MEAETHFSSLTLFCLMAVVIAELRWTTEQLSVSCCKGQNQLLMWNFYTGENDTIRQLHWYYNQATLICYHSQSTGFHVEDLYKGRVEMKGNTNILLKNVSSQDTGNYTLYPKLADEEKENVQTIRVTVYDTPRHECKPVIKPYSSRILSCSGDPCGLSPSLTQWRILGIREPVGKESFIKINSSWNSELLYCCPGGPVMQCHNETDLCTSVSISHSNDDTLLNEDLPNINAPIHTNKNHAVFGAIISVLSVLIIGLVIAFILLIRRKQTLCSRQIERPSEMQALQCVTESTDPELHERIPNRTLQIVNNINLNSDVFKGMFDSHSGLSTALHALREENANIRSYLCTREPSLQLQGQSTPNYARKKDMPIVMYRDTNDLDTDTSSGMSIYEDAIPDGKVVMDCGYVT